MKREYRNHKLITKKDIMQALKSFHSMEKAAEFLGIDFESLAKKIKTYELFGFLRKKNADQEVIWDIRESDDIHWDKSYNDKFKTYNRENIETVGPVLMPWEK